MGRMAAAERGKAQRLTGLELQIAVYRIVQTALAGISEDIARLVEGDDYDPTLSLTDGPRCDAVACLGELCRGAEVLLRRGEDDEAERLLSKAYLHACDGIAEILEMS